MFKLKLYPTIIALLLLLAGISTAQTTEDPGAAVRVEPADDGYLINPGDILDIRVFNRPQFSRETVRVDEDGRIRMPFIREDLLAACQTERGLADRIAAIYREYIQEPQVDVLIKESIIEPIAVLGSVRNPSRLQLARRKQIRLLEVLAQVGGPTEKAGRSIQVIRTGRPSVCNDAEPLTPDPLAVESEAGQLNFYPVRDILSGESKANPLINPGDIIVLPEADLMQVYVVGNVVSPATLEFEDPITLTKAIAMVGGTLPDTNRDKIRITRQRPGSNSKEELIVDLKAIEQQKAEDIILEPNDIVEVQISGGKRIIRQLLGTVVPTISSLPLRVIR